MASEGLEGSALIGMPPNNQRDLDIVRGWYRRSGQWDIDASKGYLLAAKAPEDYVFGSETKQPGIIAGMVVVILALIVPTAARLIARGRGQYTQFGSDDWAIAVATIVAMIYPILQIVAVVAGGGGRHTFENSYDNYQEYAYYLAVSKHVFYVAVGLIKISIALFVRRLADRTSKGWRRTADVFIAFVAAYILAAIFWTVFQCNPPRVAWDMRFGGTFAVAEPYQCGNSILSTIVLSVIHVVQGIMLLLCPVVILWKVKMDLAKKLRLFFIWAAGAFTVLGGLLQHATNTVVSDDIMWQYTGILTWAAVELCMGILTASLPVLDATIMGSWRAAKTKLSSAGHTNNLTSDGGPHFTNNSQTKSVVRSAPRKEYSESVEGIITGKDDGVEMSIMRTDEVRLDYESVSERDSPGQNRFHGR